ncbi:hypothetical protein [Thalassotalea sediminis]|uniref:hypothetical protein n=1 Tax=Thalassotalea sediminis TaxID=1759089 RepID=UPI002573CB61|nr:hypothetical protein [Thalassotalea sediminis]
MTNNIDRILLIGTGSFIQDTVLPAILINSDKCVVQAIVNKSGALHPEIADKVPNITAQTALSSISPETIDTVFICIPQHQVIACLKKLLQHGFQHKKIVISTPIVPLAHISRITLFRQFEHLYAFEFVPYVKSYQLAHKLIAQNNIGKLKKIQFNHCGYLYHGVAALRYLSNYRTISRIVSERFGAYYEYRFKFNRGVSATILEPKDYHVGEFMIAGTTGIISSYSLNIKNHHHIALKTDDNNQYSHISVNGEKIENTHVEQRAIQYFTASDKTLTISRQQFIMAAATLLNKIIKQESHLPRCNSAIYEHVVIRLAKKLGIYLNPLSLFNVSPLKKLLTWLSNTKPKSR